VPQTRGAAGRQIPDQQDREGEYEPQFNWPYDYLSVIELIKMDAEVLYKEDSERQRRRSGPDTSARGREERSSQQRSRTRKKAK